MTARITSAFSVLNAKSFVDAVRSNDMSVYVATGCPAPIDGLPRNDVVVPDVTSSGESAKKLMYNQILNLIRIFGGGVSRGTTRFDWANGSVFEPYREDIDVTDVTVRFYCMSSFVANSEENVNVYKCLYRPHTIAGLPVPSKTRPHHMTSSPVKLADGYIWQYMYTLTPSQGMLFLTKDFMPVPDMPTATYLPPGSQSEQLYQNKINAENGTIYYISVEKGGSELIDGEYPVTIINGIPAAPSRSMVATATIYNGSVTRITTQVPGAGYGGRCTVLLPESATTEGSIFPILKAHVSPEYGHGTNPPAELGSNFVLLATRYLYDSNNVLVRNSFRRVGLIVDPIDDLTGKSAREDYYSMVYTMELSGALEGATDNCIIEKTTLEASGVRKRLLIVSVNTTTVRFIPIDALGDNGAVDTSLLPLPEESYRVASDLAPSSVLSVTEPRIQRFSGSVIHIENRKPLNRHVGQAEQFLMVLDF